MSDLQIPDIERTTTRWSDSKSVDKALKDFREQLQQVNALSHETAKPGYLYAQDFDDFTKEAADLLLMLKHLFSKRKNGQAILYARYLKFVEKGNLIGPPKPVVEWI
jgi:hypothetical protein